MNVFVPETPFFTRNAHQIKTRVYAKTHKYIRKLREIITF